jgi:hypothetical protein
MIRNATRAALLAGSPTAAGARVYLERVLEVRPEQTPALSVVARRSSSSRFDIVGNVPRLLHLLQLSVELYVRDKIGSVVPDLVEDLGEQVLRVVDPLVHGDIPFPSLPDLILLEPECYLTSFEVEFDAEGRRIEGGALITYQVAYLEPVRIGDSSGLDYLETIAADYDFPPADGTAEARDEINLDGV